MPAGCVALVYFSGHGYGNKGDALLCPEVDGGIPASTVLFARKNAIKERDDLTEERDGFCKKLYFNYFMV